MLQLHVRTDWRVYLNLLFRILSIQKEGALKVMSLRELEYNARNVYLINHNFLIVMAMRMYLTIIQS